MNTFDKDRFIKAIRISFCNNLKNNNKPLNSRQSNHNSVIEENLLSCADDDDTIRNSTIIFQLNTNEFIKDVLLSQRKNDIDENFKKNVIVEFSSPNIAKPFHVGHLRSTIIGNFIANYHLYCGHNVKKINYLGDWGTQFGYLQIGMEHLKLNDDTIKSNPIQNLYNAYVVANQLSKTDPKIHEKAKQIFTELENQMELSEIYKKWQIYREYTIDELKTIYQRLNVEFDDYEWESQYNQQKLQNVLRILDDKQLLKTEKDGRKIIEANQRRVPIIKSDGTTLYLARDIAAILDRFERYKFDKIFYVVDNGQSDHFNALFEISEKINKELANRMQHIKFGRIKGMSTRSGNVIFLKDVLNEAKDKMMQKQLQSPTTKVDIVNLDERIADILGISAVIVNDLKQRRQRDYDFDWDKILQINGDTGIKLQYTHCRLCSLTENISVQPATKPIPELLLEPEAVELILEIAKFSEILYKTEESNFESCILVNYLFGLSNSISRALKKLNIKHESSKEIQSQRMLLFETAKHTLSNGMKILGLQPLIRM